VAVRKYPGGKTVQHAKLMIFSKRSERFSFSLGEKAGMRVVVPLTLLRVQEQRGQPQPGFIFAFFAVK